MATFVSKYILFVRKLSYLNSNMHIVFSCQSDTTHLKLISESQKRAQLEGELEAKTQELSTLKTAESQIQKVTQYHYILMTFYY